MRALALLALAVGSSVLAAPCPPGRFVVPADQQAALGLPITAILVDGDGGMAGACCRASSAATSGPRS